MCLNLNCERLNNMCDMLHVYFMLKKQTFHSFIENPVCIKDNTCFYVCGMKLKWTFVVKTFHICSLSMIRSMYNVKYHLLLHVYKYFCEWKPKKKLHVVSHFNYLFLIFISLKLLPVFLYTTTNITQLIHLKILKIINIIFTFIIFKACVLMIFRNIIFVFP